MPKRSGPKEHSVIDGKLVKTSPSQEQTYAKCPRLWYYDKVLHLPGKPEQPGQQRGTLGHQRIEDYLLKGIPLPEKTPEALMLKREFVPLYEPNEAARNYLVEHEMDDPFITAGGVRVVGYIDLVQIVEDRFIRLTDWKFKKSIAKYGCKAEELIDPDHEAGIQMISYAKFAATAWPFARMIEVRHVTGQTEGQCDVEPVSALLTPDKAHKLYERVEKNIPGMLSDAGATDAMTVRGASEDGKSGHCVAYGGCWFKPRCFNREAAELVAGWSRLFAK